MRLKCFLNIIGRFRACDFDVPDPRYGEEPCARAILQQATSPTDDELRAFCHGQIARQKIPPHIRFVRTFALTITGKVQK